MVLWVAAAMTLSISAVRTLCCLRMTAPHRAPATLTATALYGVTLYRLSTGTIDLLVFTRLRSPTMAAVRTRLEGTSIAQSASRTRTVQRANIVQ